MTRKNDDSECAPGKISPDTADQGTEQGASFIEVQTSAGDEWCDSAERRGEVRRICMYEYNRFKVPGFYSVDDLTQDVTMRSLKMLPHYRGEAKLSTILHKIAYNQLVDVVRKQRWSNSVSASDIEDSDGDVRDEGDFTAKVRRGHSEVGHYNGAERQYQIILVHELQKTWTETDRFIWNRYVAGEKVADTAAFLSITPQAVSKRKKQLINRTRKLLEGGVTAKTLTQARATA